MWLNVDIRWLICIKNHWLPHRVFRNEAVGSGRGGERCGMIFDVRGDRRRDISGSSCHTQMDTEQLDARTGLLPLLFITSPVPSLLWDTWDSNVRSAITRSKMVPRRQDRWGEIPPRALRCEEQDGVCSHAGGREGREAETSYCLFWAPRTCHLKLITLLWSESLPALFLAPSPLPSCLPLHLFPFLCPSVLFHPH